jgi:hypothetical protein
MINKEFLILQLTTMISESVNIKTTTPIIQDDDNKYVLMYEYNPTFVDILHGKHVKPFLVYECNNTLYCVTVKQYNDNHVIDVVEIITEKEEHERYNAIGIHVNVTLMGINQNEIIESKVDTGAECCSLGVEDISIMKSDVDSEAQNVKFTFNERQYTMKVDNMISVQSADGGIEYRPTVLFDIKINGHLISEVRVNLNDRSHMQYKFLIGINLLEKCDLVIDPSISEAEIQSIHDMLNEHKETVIDPDNINEVDVKPRITRQIFEMLLANPDISFKDIISMAKLDAINAVDQLQA